MLDMSDTVRAEIGRDATPTCPPLRREPRVTPCLEQQIAKRTMRGWRNTVDIVQLEISNSMKPYASAVHAYINKLRPEISLA